MDDEKERKLKTALENVKYLESQITPLAESNAKLKEYIQGLQYYMEQRRLDFASLLVQSGRELKINLGDMVNIYEWLQKDIHNYNAKIRTLETENEMFKLFIKESDDEQRKQRDQFIEKIEIQTTTIQNLNQQLFQQQEEFRKTNELQCQLHKGEVQHLELKYEKIIQEKSKEYDSLQRQYQQLDEEYQLKVKKLKQELTSQYDRQERASQVEFQKQIKELNDQITKQDIKNRQCLSELQNLKQDYQQLAQKFTLQQKANNKLTRQTENLVATIKESREEIDQLSAKNEELSKLLDQLKLQIERQTKQENELHQYIKLQKQQYTELEESVSKTIQSFNNQIATLQNQIKKNELCIKELSDMNVKMESKCREQLTKQRIKYEQILYPHRVSSSEILYKETQMQHDDSVIKDIIEDYELLLAQYYNKYQEHIDLLNKAEESFKQECLTAKNTYEKQIKQMQKDFDVRFNNEQKQSKQVIKELHRLKINELEQLAKNHQLEIKEIHYQYKSSSSNQNLEMERMKTKVTENEKVIDQLNELIIQLQDNIIELKASHEQQLELLRRNHSIGKEQLSMAFEERSANMINEIQELKMKQEEYENQKMIDQKVTNEQKRKIEQCQQTIQQLKDEGRQYSSLLNEKCLLIEQLQVQLGRQNEIVKQLQCEAENSRQVYNIFRNTSMSLKQTDDQFLKTADFKKTNNSLKFSRAKQTRKTVQRPLIQNTTMQLIVPNIEAQLPKVRSISNNQIRTTPRHHSSQM